MSIRYVLSAGTAVFTILAMLPLAEAQSISPSPDVYAGQPRHLTDRYAISPRSHAHSKKLASVAATGCIL